MNNAGTKETLRDIEFCTARDISAQLKKIGYATLLRAAHSGKVRSYRVGKRGVRFRLSEVLEDLRRDREPIAGPPSAA